MILVDREIKTLMLDGLINVDPMDLNLVNPSSLDIRLGRHYTWTRPAGHNSWIDPLDKETFLTVTEERDYYTLQPQSTILVSMLEHLTLPHGLSAKVMGKSSLARLGLDNSSQAGWIDPGWSGVITMELTNSAHYAIKLTEEMKIGQLIFFAHNYPDNPYHVKGRYQHQQAGQGSKGL